MWREDRYDRYRTPRRYTDDFDRNSFDRGGYGEGGFDDVGLDDSAFHEVARARRRPRRAQGAGYDYDTDTRWAAPSHRRRRAYHGPWRRAWRPDEWWHAIGPEPRADYDWAYEARRPERYGWTGETGRG